MAASSSLPPAKITPAKRELADLLRSAISKLAELAAKSSECVSAVDWIVCAELRLLRWKLTKSYLGLWKGD